MKDRMYIVMSKSGIRKMTKTPPAVKPNERSFVINVIVPDRLFQTPQFAGKLEIKEDDIETIDKLEFELNLLKEWKP